jgi:diacylglycerol kinase family enzyme
VESVETARAGDGRRAAASSGGCDTIVCIGGDGTLNEILNGLPERGAPPLAIVPAGTANVLAKELHLPRRPERIVELILHGRIVHRDTGVNLADGRRFLMFAGAGFDSSIVELFHRQRRGPTRMALYVAHGLKHLIGYRPPRLKVDIDGEVVARDAAWAIVSTVRHYGGPLVFTPGAESGSFEVMIQEGGGSAATLRLVIAGFLSHLSGRRLTPPRVTYYRGRRIVIRPEDGRRVPLQVDGDPGGDLPAELSLLPRSIEVIVPD